jgi:hypothetical protein
MQREKFSQRSSTDFWYLAPTNCCILLYYHNVAINFLPQGAAILDADKLGHEAYMPGTECYKKLIGHFGSSIVSSDGNET